MVQSLLREVPISSRKPTCVADTGVVDLDADLMGLWRGNLDVLDGEGLASTPGDCGL